MTGSGGYVLWRGIVLWSNVVVTFCIGGFVKCVIAQLTVLNVSVLDHVFKGLCNRFVDCFLSSMLRAVTESLWRTKIAATFMTTLLQRANPRLESILKIEVAERRDIFGVDCV